MNDWHEDDGEGGCLVCRVWVPGTDGVFNRVPFPCPTVRLLKGDLARALHDELCEALYCAEYIGDDSMGYVEHNLRREFWEAYVADVKRYVVEKTHGDPRERLVRELASYLHGDQCTCPYSVEPADIEKAERLLAEAHPPCEHGNFGWCGSCDALIERGVLG